MEQERKGKSLLHKPVLLQSFLEAVAPVRGLWVDCTFGAGGYSRALCTAGAEHVIGIDCDPDSATIGREVERAERGKFNFIGQRFGGFDKFVDFTKTPPLHGVIFDLGVSSMQLDSAQRGFSLKQEAPLDMRMDKRGRSAADIVNQASERMLADIFFCFGEERASRKIARRIVSRRASAPIASTTDLAKIVEQSVTKTQHRKTHPATRVFQALRIAVNNEFEQLVKGLAAAERSLSEGGWLAVISFHSLEDRIVKRFMRGQTRALNEDDFQPSIDRHKPRFCPINRRPIQPDRAEITANPRSRSARMRIARRNARPASEVIDFGVIGAPCISGLERV